MLGLILCGGQSSRMGSDKGLLLKDNTPWAILSFYLMDSLGLSVALSINKWQLPLYNSLFPNYQLIADDENIEVGGPLKGLLSVHHRYPDADILALACDMPAMDEIVLTDLINSYNSHPQKEAFVFTNEGNLEPLCAIYTSSALKKVMELYNHNKLPKHSLKFVLEQLDTLKIPLKIDWKQYFTNYNTQNDLGSLKV